MAAGSNLYGSLTFVKDKPHKSPESDRLRKKGKQANSIVQYQYAMSIAMQVTMRVMHVSISI